MNHSAPASPDRLDEWRQEVRAAWFYDRLATVERDPAKRALFAALATAARSQAAIWAERLPESAPAFQPAWRDRLVWFLVKRLGVRPLRPVLSALKVRGMSAYRSSPTPQMGHDGPAADGALETRHRGLGGGGNLRAAVFGINDGLLSNASLILGVAGAAASTETILLTGVAGLAAGAFSMAAGEYVSVRSQRELYERQIALEREELATYPQEEAQELAAIYTARGVPPADAQALAERLVADPRHALDTLAREELGLNPDELGSPWGAASASFAAFAAGGAIPLLPFLLGANARALPVAMTLTAVALFAIGAVLSLFTGRSALFSGARMLAIGALAGTTTFAIGRVFGVAVG